MLLMCMLLYARILIALRTYSNLNLARVRPVISARVDSWARETRELHEN